MHGKTLHKSRRKLLIAALLVGLTVLFLVKSLSNQQASQSKNVLGEIFAKGGDDSNDSDDSSGSSGSGSSGSGSSGNSGSDDSESGSSSGSNSSENSNSGGGTGGLSPTPSQTRVINPTTGVRTQTETKKNEERTEVRLSETERIRTRTKDGRTRIDITAGGIKTRLEIRDDRIVIKAEQEDGTEVELEDDAIFKIEDRLATDQIKISTDSASRFVLQRGATGAISQFPLSIDLATNTLTVTTSTGVKKLVVLPDQAVKNLILANIVNRLGGSAVVNAVRTGEVSTLAQVVELGEKNGVPIYEINGISDQKLLGFIPVSIERTVDMSTETGEVISTQTSFGDSLLDLISF